MNAKTLTELIDRLSRIVVNAGHAQGLKPAQWEALRYLAAANRFSRTPGALALWLGSTKGTVSQTVISLEARGLVTKEPAQDRRSVRLTLTQAGTQMLNGDDLANIHKEIETLDEPARKNLSASIRVLLTRLLEANGGRPFGVCHSCRHFAAGHPDGSPHYCQLLKTPLAQEEAHKICVEQQAA